MSYLMKINLYVNFLIYVQILNCYIEINNLNIHKFINSNYKILFIKCK